jgi:hypothetical protein
MAFAAHLWRLQSMTPGQARRLARKSALRQQEVVDGLQAVASSIEKADEMITSLKTQMDEVNARHQDRKTTSDDIAYLEDLLRCARKKLAWEKQMASLSKKIPEVLAAVTSVMNDPAMPPSDQTRAVVMGLLQNVQQSMARLEQAKGA